MSPVTIETVARLLYQDLWNDRRHDIAGELFHPEFRASDQAERDGGAAKLAANRRYHTTFPDLHITIDQRIAATDQVAVRWTLSGTDTGGPGDRLSTGKAVHSWGVDFLEFRDGLIIRDWVGVDWLGALTQLGLITNPWTRENQTTASHTAILVSETKS